ncbi:hypothetical protein [Burkholderia sp. Ac-20353]|uniref:hypothetical protein n=1 Tax=Burkholderia sp. Ac-20353 TaxID=2703894 RepID=UPI00197C7C8D|nr:hypothetical protein [Burkholderia sp. Ac-20353]MBN3791375.1 hypothetical protein [Burkholderia sp. Ac-20353]
MSELERDTGEVPAQVATRKETASGGKKKVGLVAQMTGLITLLVLVTTVSFNAGKKVADDARDKLNAELSADNRGLRRQVEQLESDRNVDHQRVQDAEVALAAARKDLKSERDLNLAAQQQIAQLSMQLGKASTCAPILSQINAIQDALAGRNGFGMESPPTGEKRAELLQRLDGWQKQLAACR